MKEQLYLFDTIEKKWQSYWDKQKLFFMDEKDKREKYYCLVMFPYPSGALHVGHGRNYILGDAVTRYKIMKGYNVLSPIGWDAFGLPAENAAIKGGLHPKESTLKNIETMKKQLRQWGIGYDWAREVTSCMPDYYKWTQWIFLKLFEKGLAYKKKAPVRDTEFRCSLREPQRSRKQNNPRPSRSNTANAVHRSSATSTTRKYRPHKHVTSR